MMLSLERVELSLGDFRLQLDEKLCSSVTGIFGPSGSGKTSLLETIAGLRHPKAGAAILDGEILFDSHQRIFRPPERRRIGYVPQDLALFPHLNVRQNLLFGVPPKGPSSENLSLDHIIDVLELGTWIDRDIKSLSGGERQRVAFARALLASPRLILLDEPLSNLDYALKERITGFLIRIRDEFKIPIIYVSHDPNELAAVCEEILIMEHGRCLQRGKFDSLFEPVDVPYYVRRTS